MADEATFQRGDIVKLKSGGPKMTVEVSGPVDTTCIWFDSPGKKSEYNFPTVALEKVLPPKSTMPVGGTDFD